MKYGQKKLLINLEESIASAPLKIIYRLFKSPLEKILAVNQLNRMYTKILQNPVQNFFDSCLNTARINYSLNQIEIDKIPKQGSLVVVANHPFGGIEGVILGSILTKVRPDVKILGNYLLHEIEPIKDMVIPVDPFGFKHSGANNIKGLKKAIDWLKKGGALITFPSGRVSHLQWRHLEINDPQWNPHIAAIIRKTKATVQSMYFSGQNSWLFQLLGIIHPRIRTAMLPRELVNKKDQTLNVLAGKPIMWKKLQNFENDRELIKFLRIKTYFLKNKKKRIKISLPDIALKKKSASIIQELVKPVALKAIETEFRNLEPDHLLVESGKFKVYCAHALKIPNILKEIGRLREVTYRHAKEGTGKPFDLDRFDEHFEHLILWDEENKKLVGAYRVARADEIVGKFGFSGLYTSTIFEYKTELMKYLINAVELGRSFIRVEYQKTPSALALLWRGIGEFVVRNPKYYKLFGPVSISQDYHVVSQNLMVQFIQSKRWDADLSRYVNPKYPFRINNLSLSDRLAFNATLRDIDDVSMLIAQLEDDGKGVPVLLRHYLKLNARLLSFSVDVNFSNVLDGLIMVDLRRTDPKLLKRFLGEGFEKFAWWHKMQDGNVLKTA